MSMCLSFRGLLLLRVSNLVFVIIVCFWVHDFFHSRRALTILMIVQSDMELLVRREI